MSKKSDEWDDKDKKKDKTIDELLNMAKSYIPTLDRSYQNHVSMTLSDEEMEAIGKLLKEMRKKK